MAGLIGGGAPTSGYRWYQQAWNYDSDLHRSYFAPHLGYDHETFLLVLAVILLFRALSGGLIVRGILSFFIK